MTCLIVSALLLAVGCDFAGSEKRDEPAAIDTQALNDVAAGAERWELVLEADSQKGFLLNSASGQMYRLQVGVDGAIKWTDATPPGRGIVVDVKVLGYAKEVPVEDRLDGGVYVLDDGSLGRWESARSEFTRTYHTKAPRFFLDGGSEPADGMSAADRRALELLERINDRTGQTRSDGTPVPDSREAIEAEIIESMSEAELRELTLKLLREE